jgi:MtN3 and saliva related transmembrane protein
MRGVQIGTVLLIVTFFNLHISSSDISSSANLHITFLMNWYDYMGYFGSFLTSITFIPQVYKAWQTRSVGDLSSWMVIIVVASASIWLVYGIAINSGPVIVANSVVLMFALVLLYFTFRFKS